MTPGRIGKARADNAADITRSGRLDARDPAKHIAAIRHDGPSTLTALVSHVVQVMVATRRRGSPIQIRRAGRFKVILDEGINPPGKVPFAAGFVRSKATARPFTARPGEAPEETLIAADRALGEAIAARGAASAFESVMHDAVRVHRNGVLPMTSRAEATRWLATSVKAMSSKPEKSESSAAGDLGYTWGKATVTGQNGEAQTGYYVRVWTRRADGGWQLAADIAQQ